MSDSVQPHRRQPTRLRHPWDSPGKNTGVGCHFLLQCMKVKSESEVAQSCPTLSEPMDCSLPGSSVHGIHGKSTGVGCHCLFCEGMDDSIQIMWETPQKKAEATLKQALSQAPALRLPKPVKAFQLYNHEKEGIALGVLTQRLGLSPSL